jgi:hypothetical protein
MMLVFRSIECKKCGVVEVFLKIAKESLGGQGAYSRDRDVKQPLRCQGVKL